MKRLIALSVVALVAAACAAGGAGSSPNPSPSLSPSPSPSGTPRTDHPTGANELVLRIGYDGGFVAPGYLLTRLPQVSVYGDGRVVTEGPVIEIYPGPALPNLLVSRLSEAGLQAMLAAAADAGLLGRDRHYDYVGIADAPTTTFVVITDGATHTTTAYALGIGEDRPDGMPASDAAARNALAGFQAKMADLRSWLGAEVLSGEQPYAFEQLRVFATPAEPTSPDGQVQPTVVDWPLLEPLATAGTPLEGFGGVGMRCSVVAGDELATLRPVLEAANQLTFVRSGGATYSIALRPLLPDESGCPTT